MVTAIDLSSLRAMDAEVDELRRAGDIGLRVAHRDTVLAGRHHERYDQYIDGIRVFGGDLVRQIRDGVTESIFGQLYDKAALVPVANRLTEDEARARFGELAGTHAGPERPLEMVLLPRDDATIAVAWRAHVWTDEGRMNTFLHAGTGEVLLQYNDLQTQAAVGTGTGVLGDRKKVSTRESGGRYWADDQLRPPRLVTYDVGGNLSRAIAIIDGASPFLDEVANDADNAWSDAANVDAHVYLGWTYDYFYKRFGRRGLDDRDAPVQALTHPVRRSELFFMPASALRFYINASWCGACGPGERGLMVFGEGLPPGVTTTDGKRWDYLAGALDIVAHELAHGLTDYTSDLLYRNESGALNEAFSDFMGTGAEHYYRQQGSGVGVADYLIGEDVVTPGGLRSMANPLSYGDPDHYSRRYRGVEDNGGVHINSSIANQAFYLAIEGGVNRTSGISVQGVGPANREQIEKAFYRGFVFMLPSSATFSMARAATVQSARDLYGVGSAVERAVTEAWTAVGVN